MSGERRVREREIDLRAREASAYLEKYRREKGAWWDDREQGLLVDALPPAAGRVLDAGAGVGRLTSRLSRRGYAVDSVDLSFESLVVLARAWSAERRIRAAVCDLSVGLPVRSAVYGGAVSAQTIQHIPDRRGRVTAWAEVRRACRPSAVLSATVYHRKPWQETDGVFPNGPAYHRYSVDDLRAELAEAGWHVTAVRLCYRFEWKRLPAALAQLLDELFGRVHVLDRMGTYIHVVAVAR